MSIIGVTDQNPSFPQIGILRKGAPKPVAGNKPGADLTYFRFVTQDAAAMQIFAAAYGEEPRRINLYLPFATTDENLDAWMELWVAGGLKHRCDGETAVLWQREDGTYSTQAIPCPSLAAGTQGKAGGCKPSVRLQVIVPELERLAHVLVLSTSWHDARELASNIRAAENVAHMMGRDLRGIPFVLSRVQREISTPSGTGGTRARRGKWLLHVEPAAPWVALQIEAARQMARPQIEGNAQMQLAAPIEDDDEDYENGTDAEDVDRVSVDGQRTLVDTPATYTVIPPTITVGDNVDPNARPWQPERLRELILRRIGEDSDELCVSKTRNVVAIKIKECFAGKSNAALLSLRVIGYLVSINSLMVLTKSQAKVLLDWLVESAPDATGDYPLKPFPAREAALIIEHLDAQRASEKSALSYDGILFDESQAADEAA